MPFYSKEKNMLYNVTFDDTKKNNFCSVRGKFEGL